MVKLQIDDLYKHFGPTRAIDGLSLKVYDGEMLAVLGPSGCGKSTLLSCIAGIERPDRGEVRLLDRIVFSGEGGTDTAPEARNIGFVFQHYALWPHMTVSRNIAYPLKMRGRSKDYTRKELERIMRLLKLEGKEERRPYELSGGEQQRVALGRALVMNPDLLLLDEPLSNLDARLRENMQEEIRNLQKELHLTVIHVTHDQTEAMAMADRIAVMNAGRLLQIGRPEEIYEQPRAEFVADFVGTNNLFTAEVAEGDRKLCFGEGLGICAENPGGVSEGPRRVVCAVRPEEVELYKKDAVPEERGEEETARGVIRKRIYRGAHIMYEIAAGKMRIRAQVHPGEVFTVGETVSFAFRRVAVLE